MGSSRLSVVVSDSVADLNVVWSNSDQAEAMMTMVTIVHAFCYLAIIENSLGNFKNNG